jgi:hypothetical protein
MSDHSILSLLAPMLAIVLLWLGLTVQRKHRSRSIRRIAGLGRQLRQQSQAKKPWDVAVSYSSRDAAVVDPILDLLNSAGLRIFDYRDEDVLPKTIGKRLKAVLQDIYGGKADVCVAFLSPSYFNSTITVEELSTSLQHDASTLNRYLLPVLARRCKLPDDIAAVVHLDARNVRPEVIAISILNVLLDRAVANARPAARSPASSVPKDHPIN